MFNGHKIIALCITKINDEKNVDLIYALNTAALKLGYRIFIYNSCSDFYWHNLNEEGEKRVYDLIDYSITDAVMIFDEAFKDTSVTDDIYRKANEHGVPVIYIGTKKSCGTSYVFDYEAGFEKVVRHIIEEHGITDTAMIAGIKGDADSEKRVDVYKKVLKENNIPFDPNRLSYGDYWFGPTTTAVEKMIADNDVPKAIICANDMMAITVCNVLKEHGITVPDDVAVSGFDGIDAAKQAVPPITTSKCSYEALADKVMEGLTRIFNSQPVDAVNYIGYVIDIYTSCGCKPDREPVNIGKKLQDVSDIMHRFLDDSNLLKETTDQIMTGKSQKDVVKNLSKFKFYDTCIMLNKCFWDESINPVGEEFEGFKDEMCVLYSTDDDISEYPKNIMRSDIMPCIDEIIEKGCPIVFTVLSFIGVPMGYMCVHFEPTVEKYCYITQYVNSLDHALSGYRNIRHLEFTAKSIQKISENDYMTGIYNRNGFYKALHAMTCAKERADYVVASIDMDGLKNINDIYGHKEGDFAIQQIANAIKVLPVENKICGRFGGDEFVVFALLDSGTDGSLIEKHINAYLNDINEKSGKPYKITASTGIIRSEPNGFNFDELLKKSDELMYAEKCRKPERRKN